jgi:hypothetical protein
MNTECLVALGEMLRYPAWPRPSWTPGIAAASEGRISAAEAARRA